MKAINASGKIKLIPNTEYDVINASGKVKCEGSVRAKSVAVNGKIKIDGDLLVSGDINITGKAKVGSVSCKDFNGIGGIDMSSISAKNVIVVISNDCRIEKIISEEAVEVGKKENSLLEDKVAQSFLNLLNIDFDYGKCKEAAKLYVDEIVGNNVRLDNVVAKSVIGNNIIIGKNCYIETVKYNDEINIDETSKVNIVEKQ